MSSTVSPVDQTEVRTDKPMAESVAVEKSTSSEQTDSLNTNDTNSSIQNEVGHMKRDSSEITGIEEKTPARTKKTRTDRFKEESEALLKSFGLEDGPGSEKRLTRSRTGRGTPVSTPVSKPEPVKQTTGAKRGRKPSEKKEQPVGEDEIVKATPKKGRGRPKQSAVVDNGESSSATEESSVKVETTLSAAGDQNEKPTDVKEKPESKTEDNKEVTSAEENKLKVPEVIVTEEDATDPSTDKASDKTDKTNDNTDTESSKPEKTLDSLAVQKEEVKGKLTNLNESKPVESKKEATAILNSTVEKVTTNDTTSSKVENNLTNNNQPVKDQGKKIESVDQSAKTVEQSTEKVVASNKLSSESVEKKEVQTA